VTPKELSLAKSLVEGMAGDWDPEDYDDEYRDALMKLIKKRIAAGQTEASPEEEGEIEEPPPTVNFMEVLKRSVASQSKPKKPARSRASRRKPRKQKAG
jgi:DNA end-binding protein Ku